MEFTFSPTLKHRALLKITTSLWNEKTIYNQISTWITSGEPAQKHRVWQDIIRIVSENVNELPLPSSSKRQITSLIRPIGDEIQSWWGQHNAFTLRNNHLKRPLDFIWTPQGTIDKRETAIDLVRNEDIDIVHRYYWACFYCLEHEIPILWYRIYKSDSYNLAKELSYHATVAYWTLQMDRNLTWLTSEVPASSDFRALFHQCSSNLFVFEKLCYGNGQCHQHLLSPGGIELIVKDRCSCEAAEFFWRKLSPQERQRFSADVSISRCESDDMVYFIFSHLDEENKMRVLRRYNKKILTCFLEWPRHEHLIKVASRAMDFFRDRTLLALFDILVRKIGSGKDAYVELFAKIWELCSKSCQKRLTDRGIDENFLFLFRTLEDKRPILVILNCFIRINKEGIFHPHALQYCRNLAAASQWELFKDLLEEHLPSVESVFEFKKCYDVHYKLWLCKAPPSYESDLLSQRPAVLRDSSGLTTEISTSLTLTSATERVFYFLLKAMAKRKGVIFLGSKQE